MRVSIEALRQFAPLVDHLRWHGIDIADVECFETLYEPTPQTLIPAGMSIFETLIAGVRVRLKSGGSEYLPLPPELIAKIVERERAPGMSPTTVEDRFEIDTHSWPAWEPPV